LGARLLEKEPGARPASAAEVIAVLDGCITAPAPQAPVIVVPRADTPGPRSPSASDALSAHLRVAREHGMAFVDRVVVDAKRRPNAAIAVATGIGAIAVAAFLLIAIALLRKPTKLAAAPRANVVAPAAPTSGATRIGDPPAS